MGVQSVCNISPAGGWDSSMQEAPSVPQGIGLTGLHSNATFCAKSPHAQYVGPDLLMAAATTH